MTWEKLEGNTSLQLVSRGCLNREISGVYCGDLLSMVMGRAQEDQLWITVMGNVNAVAVAVLADLGGMVLSEGAKLDAAAQKRVKEEDIWVFATELPTFETAMLVAKLL